MERQPILGSNKWYERRRDEARERTAAPPSTTKAVSALIAEFMLWMLLVADKRSARNSARKALVITRWMQLSGDRLKVPFPGVVML